MGDGGSILWAPDYRIYFPKKDSFLYIARPIDRKWAWRTNLSPSPFCHYLIYFAILSPFEAIPRKLQQV